jgi:uncharacterized membrane protein YjjP (DUF1212 family)
VTAVKFIPTDTSTRSFADQLLCLALDVGEGVLKNGGEVHRVEDTVERICHAYGASHVEVFAITTLILASVRMEDGSYSSQIRRVPRSSNYFARFEEYNRISREVCQNTPPLQEFHEMLVAVKKQVSYPRWIAVFGGGLTAGMFSILFGGSLRDCLASFLIGLLLSALSTYHFETINMLAKTVIMSLLSGVLSYAIVLVGIGENLDMIMIGTIMLLIPGLAFGNAIRDLLCGDILAGILKTVQSCLTAILIACGFLISILILAPTGVPQGGTPLAHSFAIQLVAAVLGSIGFALMFYLRARYMPAIALGGGLTYTVYVLFCGLGLSLFLAAFFAAIFAALFGELCAKLLRAPTLMFVSLFTISIVPGGGLYYTMSALLASDRVSLNSNFSSTLLISAGLATGTMLVTIAVGAFKNWRREAQKKAR